MPCVQSQLDIKAHLRFKITVNNTLQMAKGNNIQYLDQDSLCFVFCVFATPAEIKQTTIHGLTAAQFRSPFYPPLSETKTWKYKISA